MTANELRIGSWVYHNPLAWSYRNDDGVISNYVKFMEDCFQWEESDWYAMGECTLSLDAIEPISLTEEWLLKFGFTKSFAVTNFAIQIEAGVLDLTPSENVGYHVYIDDNWICTIESVHELQNLYFALTGQELNIN
jgi:hypothetical protein